jgi:hypothetical protein
VPVQCFGSSPATQHSRSRNIESISNPCNTGQLAGNIAGTQTVS